MFLWQPGREEHEASQRAFILKLRSCHFHRLGMMEMPTGTHDLRFHMGILRFRGCKCAVDYSVYLQESPQVEVLVQTQ